MAAAATPVAAGALVEEITYTGIAMRVIERDPAYALLPVFDSGRPVAGMDIAARKLTVIEKLYCTQYKV